MAGMKRLRLVSKQDSMAIEGVRPIGRYLERKKERKKNKEEYNNKISLMTSHFFTFLFYSEHRKKLAQTQRRLTALRKKQKVKKSPAK